MGEIYYITPAAPNPRTFTSEYLSVISRAVPMIWLVTNVTIIEVIEGCRWGNYWGRAIKWFIEEECAIVLLFLLLSFHVPVDRAWEVTSYLDTKGLTGLPRAIPGGRIGPQERLGLHYPTNTHMLVRPKSLHTCREFTLSYTSLSHSFVLKTDIYFEKGTSATT